MGYDALVVCGVAFFASLPFLGAVGTDGSGWMRHAYQAYLFLVIGLYFVASWRRRGQTLAMKAWKLRLAAAGGGRISLRQAMLRYAWAWPSLLLAGIGICYALFDRERQFLHDRLSGTRIVAAE
jgi:uncharacterized RDD family membrane protein YckC